MSQLPSLQPSSTHWVVSLQTLLCQHLSLRCHGNQRPHLKMLYKVCKQKDALELQGFKKSITWLRIKDYLCTFWKNGSLHLQSSELGGVSVSSQKANVPTSRDLLVAAGCCGPGDVADPVTVRAHHLTVATERDLRNSHSGEALAFRCLHSLHHL